VRFQLMASPGVETPVSANLSLSPAVIAGEMAPEIERLKLRFERQHNYQSYTPRSDALCAHYAARALRVLWPSRKPFTLADLRAKGMLPKYERLLASLLAMAEQDGFLAAESDGRWRHISDSEPEILFRRMVGDFPKYAAELVLLNQCGTHLAQVLR